MNYSKRIKLSFFILLLLSISFISPLKIVSFKEKNKVYDFTTDLSENLLTSKPENSFYSNYLKNEITSMYNYSYYNITTISDWIDINNSLIENNGNVSIAILDTGVNHTEVMGSYTTIPNSNITYDDNGHGSFIASIIKQLALQSNIYSIKIANEEGESNISWLIEGIQLALDLNSSIIQLSVGINDVLEFPDSIINEIFQKNVSIVCSAGNSGPSASSIMFPADYNFTISVGMTENNSVMSKYSSTGPRLSGILGPDIIAPGFISTSIDGSNQLLNRSGTSYSTAVVTGGLALLRSTFPNITSTRLHTALFKAANFTKILDSPSRIGNGFIDVEETINILTTFENRSLITLTPKSFDSRYDYYKINVNGDSKIFKLGIFTDSNLKLVNYTYNYSNNIKLSLNQVPLNISSGLNIVELLLSIPSNIQMNSTLTNLKLIFMNSEGESLFEILRLSITNIFPAGNILMSQLHDLDIFMSDGPTGKFNVLENILSSNGYNVDGVIRSDSKLAPFGSLKTNPSDNNEITSETLFKSNILVISDIEAELTTTEINFINDWVKNGHSLLVLSVGSNKISNIEYGSNSVALNQLLDTYGIILNNHTSNISETVETLDETFLSPGNFIDYQGTTLNIDKSKNSYLFLSDNQNNSIGAAWEGSNGGRVLVFGSDYLFSDSTLSNIQNDNKILLLESIDWLMKKQHPEIKEFLINGNMIVGERIEIQMQIENYPFNQINATVIDSNDTLYQFQLVKNINLYVGGWTPDVSGESTLYFNIDIEGFSPINGHISLLINEPTSSDFFFLILLLGVVIIGLSIFYMSRQSLTEEKSLARMQMFQPRKSTKKKLRPRGLEISSSCLRCGTPKYADESKYCYQCGNEL